MAMARVSLGPSEQTESKPGAHGNVENAAINSKPVNVVSPMIVQLPEKKSLDGRDGRFMQETMSPKSTLGLEDLYLKDVVPNGSTLAFKIAQMLNRDNNRIIRNWRHLAELLDVPGDVCLSFMCDQEHSPTGDLFDYLETWKPGMTIGDLKTSLRRMGRNDLITILQSKEIPDNSKVCDYLEIVETFKEKLDIKSRTLSWMQLAIKFGIPKKTYTKFGKPKLGPTSQLFLHIRLSDSFKNLSIGKLREHIKDMDRFDVIRVLEQHKVQDNTLVKDVFKVDSQILEETAELLDKDLRSTKNWRNLAVRLEISNHTYEDFDTSKDNNKNPTMLLLEWLAVSQPDLKAVTFIKHLRKIQRNDVVEELEKEMPAALKRINYQKRVEEPSETTCEGSVFRGSSVVSDCLSANHSANTASISTEQQLHQLPVTQLPRKIYDKVCSRLDAEDSFFHDYRMLAEELGVASEKIRILGQKTSSPTHSLLIDHKLKVKQFLYILKKIEREDVMEVIETLLPNKKSSNNPESSDSSLAVQ